MTPRCTSPSIWIVAAAGFVVYYFLLGKPQQKDGTDANNGNDNQSEDGAVANVKQTNHHDDETSARAPYPWESLVLSWKGT